MTPARRRARHPSATTRSLSQRDDALDAIVLAQRRRPRPVEQEDGAAVRVDDGAVAEEIEREHGGGEPLGLAPRALADELPGWRDEPRARLSAASGFSG